MPPKRRLAAEKKIANGGIRKHSNKAPKLVGKTIEIVVGKEATTFHVHKNLICGSSNFFKSAMNGNWKESNGLVRLPEETPEVFEIYVGWLYVHSIFSEKEGDISDMDQPHESDDELERLLQLYVCGEHLRDHRFCNAVVDALCEEAQHENTYPITLGVDAYEQSAPSSPIRRLLVDMFAHVANESWLAEFADFDTEARCEFYEDVLRKVLELRDSPTRPSTSYPWVQDICTYHEHSDGHPKCSDKSS